MTRVVLALGSNLGDRLSNLQAAIDLLSDRGVVVTKVSGVWETEPVPAGQPRYLNAVVASETTLDPRGLLALAKEVEFLLGRRPSPRWSPRPADVDILFFDDEKVDEPDLQVPHMNWFFYLARICNHCTYPACLASCPRGSIYKRPDDGIVLIDQSRCRGYQECVKACPYKKVFYNPMTGTSEKCIACFPKIEMGEQPQCFVNCIGKIRLAGFISTPDQAREDNPIDYLVHVRKLALPLFPQFGLEPNIYYVPPIHASRPFLRQMFGPNVDQAIETYRAASEDANLSGLLSLFGSTSRLVARWQRHADTVLGFDESGSELVRVPLREPVYIREAFDAAQGVVRSNVP